MTSKKEQWKGKRRDGRRRGRRIDRDTGARAGEDGKQKKRSVFWQGTGLSTSRQGIDFHLAASFTFFFFFPPPPPSSSSLPVIEISHPFPPFLVPIDTLVIDSAAQPSGKLNKRNLITGGFCWESFSRYYTLGRVFSLFFFFSLFRRAISNKSFESIMRISRNEILQSTRSTKLWFLWTGWFEGGGGGHVCVRSKMKRRIVICGEYRLRNPWVCRSVNPASSFETAVKICCDAVCCFARSPAESR